MKNYVAGFMKDSRDRIALVRKNKPSWQAGRLNGIGGGVDGVETPLDAMSREWFEETGDIFDEWQFFAELRFDDCAVHFFKANVVELPTFPSHNDIGESIEVWDFSIVVRSDLVIPNLRWLMPLAFEDPAAGYVRSTPWPHLMAANDNALPATQVAA